MTKDEATLKIKLHVREALETDRSSMADIARDLGVPFNCVKYWKSGLYMPDAPALIVLEDYYAGIINRILGRYP